MRAVTLNKILREVNLEQVLEQMLRVDLSLGKPEEDHAAEVGHGTVQHDAVTLSRVGKRRAIVAVH